MCICTATSWIQGSRCKALELQSTENDPRRRVRTRRDTRRPDRTRPREQTADKLAWIELDAQNTCTRWRPYAGPIICMTPPLNSGRTTIKDTHGLRLQVAPLPVVPRVTLPPSSAVPCIPLFPFPSRLSFAFACRFAPISPLVPLSPLAHFPRLARFTANGKTRILKTHNYWIHACTELAKPVHQGPPVYLPVINGCARLRLVADVIVEECTPVTHIINTITMNRLWTINISHITGIPQHLITRPCRIR